jgi:uncharacterized protein (DUF433 family)
MAIDTDALALACYEPPVIPTLGAQRTVKRILILNEWSNAMKAQLITIDPEIHSGSPVFAGTRVPVKTLFDHLQAGDSLEVFLDDFPSVSRELAVAVLDEARAALIADAHPA